jgi:DNA-binding MarR family transcriptional regulator
MDFLPKNAAGLYFRKKIRRDLQTVSLDADMISLLLVIDEHKSLYQIAAEVELDGASFKRTLKRLLEQGLVEIVQKRAPRLGNAFLQAVRANLIRTIGPVAEIILEEAVADLSLTPPDITVDQAAELVYRISREIPDEDSRTQFQNSIMPILNKLKP